MANNLPRGGISRLPFEMYELIALHCALGCRETEYPGPIAEELKRLRLVNKRFCHAATPLLFRRVKAQVGDFFGNPLLVLESIARSNFAPFVRKLILGADELEDRGEISRYIRRLHGALPVCFVQFKNLEYVQLDTPWSAHFDFTLLGKETMVEILLRTLREHPLRRLKDLRIQRFAAIPYKEKVLASLIPVMPTLQGLALNFDPFHSTPLETGLFSALEHASSLRFLEANGFGHDPKVSIDAICSQAPLSDLDIGDFTISFDEMRSIRKFAGTLHHLGLYRVKLTDGTWTSFIEDLYDFPRLRAYWSLECFYSKDTLDTRSQREADFVAEKNLVDVLYRKDGMEDGPAFWYWFKCGSYLHENWCD